MWTLIRAGGVIPMSFILVFGVIALGAGFFFALRAERRTLGFVVAMTRATVYATLAATFADVGATLVAVNHAFDEASAAAQTRAVHMLVEGLAESTSPGILGFSFVGMAWMLVAVGRRRLDEREGAFSSSVTARID